MEAQNNKSEKFKITIKQKGEKSETYHLWELINTCWDYIFELERGNPNKILQDQEMLDSLMQNYYTCKMVYTECGTVPNNDMKEINSFIMKHLKIMFAKDNLEEATTRLPKMHFSNVPNKSNCKSVG